MEAERQLFLWSELKAARKGKDPKREQSSNDGAALGDWLMERGSEMSCQGDSELSTLGE